MILILTITCSCSLRILECFYAASLVPLCQMGFSEPLVVNYAASFSVEVHGAAGLNDGVDR